MDLREIKYSVTKDADKKLFPIIKELIEKYNGSDFRIEGNKIVYVDATEGVKYLYSMGVGDVKEERQELSIDSQGASWFREMRGDGVADDRIKASNKWQTLITKLSEEFYKNNPILYYEDTSTDFNVDPECDRYLRMLVDSFFDEKSITLIKNEEQSTRLIYAASLRLAVGLSLVPQPVLGKIYFSLNSDGTLRFLTKEEASKLEDSLQNVSAENAGAVPAVESDVGAIVTALKSMLENKEHLEKSLLFNKDNESVIQRMTEKQRGENREDALPVEILKVTINTIFVMKVRTTEYKICFNRFTRVKTPVLSAQIFFDKITLRCQACGSGAELISSNVVNYINAAGRSVSAEILFGKEGFDLRVAGRTLGAEEVKSAIEEIKESVFSKHLRRVECDACAARDACIGYVCEDKQLPVKNVDEEGNEERVVRCADCVYPESFIFVNGEAYTTRSVFYDVNERRLRLRVDQNGARTTCSICGRAYYRSSGSLDMCCTLCASLSENDEVQLRKQKALYKKYEGLLPLHKRISAKEKRCVEDQSVIVFRAGKVYHVFDKLAAVVSGEDCLTGRTVTLDGEGEV